MTFRRLGPFQGKYAYLATEILTRYDDCKNTGRDQPQNSRTAGITVDLGKTAAIERGLGCRFRFGFSVMDSLSIARYQEARSLAEWKWQPQ